jgi:AIPR protein/Sulfite exporter TauE/SafE
LTLEFFALVAIGFFAQLVDGALGMAFGLISTTALLSLGIPPAQASAAVHTAEVVTTGASGLSHLFHRNIHRRLLLTLAMAGVLGGVLGAYVLSNIDGRAIRPFVSAYLLVIGMLILMKAVKLAPTNEDAKVGYPRRSVLWADFWMRSAAVGGDRWSPRPEEISRRVLSRGAPGSQIQTHWYYERTRGQHLNDQGISSAKAKQFLLVNPRDQVIKKTDLAKIECCFNLEPDIACKGAEKAFTSFAERIAREWEDESRRLVYGDDWFKSAVARVILFRAAERIVSAASWYESGYRAQIVAYTCARLAKLALDQDDSGGLDYMKVWHDQVVESVLERQIDRIGEAMASVLLSPPLAGQNISEWAKQQGCRRAAMEKSVRMVPGFSDWIVAGDDHRANRRQQKATGAIDDSLEAIKHVMKLGAGYWEALRRISRSKHILQPEDEKALVPACQMPGMVPTERQAARLLLLLKLAEDGGWKGR